MLRCSGRHIGDVVHARLGLEHTDHPVRCRHRPPDPEYVREVKFGVADIRSY